MDPAMVWARAVLLAAVTMFLGVAGHVTADGLLPSVIWLVVLGLLAVVPCAALLARPASSLRIVLTLVGGQALVHLALTVAAGHTATAGVGHEHASGPRSHLDGAGSALETLQAAPLGTTSAGPTASGLLGHAIDHAPMMAVHVLAATLVGLWLAVGERALWTLVALAGALVLRPLVRLDRLAGAALSELPLLGPAAVEPRAPAPPRLLARCVVRRGPPLLAI